MLKLSQINLQKLLDQRKLVAEYTDRNGKRMKVKAKELLAQAICHEVDHLNGEVFIDKIMPWNFRVCRTRK